MIFQHKIKCLKEVSWWCNIQYKHKFKQMGKLILLENTHAEIVPYSTVCFSHWTRVITVGRPICFTQSIAQVFILYRLQKHPDVMVKQKVWVKCGSLMWAYWTIIASQIFNTAPSPEEISFLVSHMLPEHVPTTLSLCKILHPTSVCLVPSCPCNS